MFSTTFQKCFPRKREKELSKFIETFGRQLAVIKMLPIAFYEIERGREGVFYAHLGFRTLLFKSAYTKKTALNIIFSQCLRRAQYIIHKFQDQICNVKILKCSFNKKTINIIFSCIGNCLMLHFFNNNFYKRSCSSEE